MKILFIAPRLPYPADTGGKIRTLNILKQIRKFSDAHLACFSFEKNDRETAMALEKSLGVPITLMPMHKFGIRDKIHGVLFNPAPISIFKYCFKPMEKILLSLNERENFDAVHIDHLHMAYYHFCFAALPSVLDEHNVEYRILERCAAVERSVLKKKIYQEQALKMKMFERKAIKTFSACLTVSQDDKDMLMDLAKGKANVEVIPNGVDTGYFSSLVPRPTSQEQKDKDFNADSRESNADNREFHLRPSACNLRPSAFKEESLVFTGSMDWLPNEDSVLYFAKEILPLIWQVKSDVKFYIVGKNPSSKVRHLSRDQRIIVTGGVDDVRPYMERSKVFVVPLRIGGGTRLKILEAMSMNMAVVSTSVGAQSITYIKDQNILIADAPQEFAQSVLSLIDDQDRAFQLGREGRAFVCEKYNWNIVGKNLSVLYERIITKR